MDKDRSLYRHLTVLGGTLDNCLWFLLPEEFFADLMDIVSENKHIVGTQENHLKEMVLLSTQNICLNWWIRKKSQKAEMFVYHTLTDNLNQFTCNCGTIYLMKYSILGYIWSEIWHIVSSCHGYFILCMICIRVNGLYNNVCMKKMGSYDIRNKWGVFFLKDYGNDIVSYVSFSLQLLRITLRIWQQCRNVKHDFFLVKLRVHWFCTSLSVNCV